MEDYRLEQTGQEVQRILNGAAMDANLQAEVERATDAEGTLQSNIDVEERARQDADGLLQQGIDDEAQRAKDAEEANAGEIEGIKALIPSTASDANKLADTNYVNSSIQTATAEYRGDYNVVTDLHLAIDATHAQIETLLPTVIAEADKNDYCYVMIPTSAQTPTEIAKIERYKMTSEGWKFEYDVNNSTFTAEEWAAIKSGVTSGLVAKLNALPTNADLLLLLAGKQDVLTFDSVPVPESNNPVKSGGVYSAIDDEKTARLNSDTAIHAELDGLQAKVPATASSDNKLVDQNQMNSSISTATATFRGDWNVVSDLHLAVDATRAQIAALLPTVISTADNNDYCYVEIPTSAETPAQIERVERYKFNGTAWGYEYTLNNSGFTADQWAAINSMITSGLVAKLSALPTNADLLAMLAQKQDNLTFDSTPTENSTNPVTSGGVFAADKALSDAIEAILLLIPSAASALNKLVDTALLNSSISTATATFRGTYNLVSDLGLGIDATEGQIAAALLSAISTADNNDYAFVQIPTSAEAPAQIARTDRYKFNGTAWAFEYTLNTSGFTAQQWAAINSTITSALVAKLNALPTAAELQEALGTLTSGITAINQKIPSTASQANKLVDASTMESYIAQVINILDASFNVTSTDGHITLHITQVDGVITSVQVQSTDIASAADLALKSSQADLTALASRVTTAEGNITSLTGRMGTAETNIAYLQQLYNNLQQSKPVPVIALPSTGQQQGVIYRLAGTTSYSDYMWDGSSWVLMATYNNAIDPRPKKASQNLVTSGGVFDNIGALDVSELNATENPHTLAQYADLSSALAAIPTDYQKGGMSIKFVQSSDNKYVQYRYMSNSIAAADFTNVANWQGVDNIPIIGSNNLVKSGGVLQNYIEKKLGANLALPQEFTRGVTISAAGAIQTGFSNSYIVTGFIPVNGQNISANMWAGSASYSAGNVYDSNFKFIRTLGQVSKYTYQSGDVYVRLCIRDEADNRPRAFYGDTLKMYEVSSPIIGYQDIDTNSHALNILNGDAYKRVRELYLVGLDLTKTYKAELCNVYISGNYYETRVSIKDGDTIIAGWYELVNGYTGIVQFTEKNNSGVSGWGFVDIPSNVTDVVNAEINNIAVSNIDFNPNIRSAVYGIYTNIENKNIYKHVRLLLSNGATVGSVVNSSFQNVDSKCVVFSHVKKGDVCRLTAPEGYDGDYTLPSYIFIDNDNKCVEYSAARLQNILKVATTDGTMYIQGAMSDTIKFQRLEETPKVFNVTKEGVGFSSLLEGILEATKYVGSTLYVGKGTYDVESEFKAHYGNDFFTNFASDSKVLGMYLKNRVKVIFDSGAKVVFNYEGGNQYVNSLFSPFNGDILGFEIENLDIECANCRYCIHDELGHLFTPYKNVYKNCKMTLDNTQNEHWASSQCIGGGLGPTGEIIIKDCYFNSVESNGSAVSYHNSSANNAMSTIVVSGCYFEGQNSLAFGCYGQSTKKTRVIASNNSLGGEITKWFQTQDSQDNIELIKFNNTIRQVQ